MNIQMVAPSPKCEWSCLLLPDLLSAGDLDRASGCFSRCACLRTPDGTGVHGRGRIRSVLAQLIACNPQIAVDMRQVVVARNVALVRERWTIRIDGAEGTRFEQVFAPTLVAHLVEGLWKLAIAAPWERSK